jgi:predicted component of type VI protein secretion system
MNRRISWAACALPLVLALGCKDSSPSKAPQTQPPPTPSKVATFPQLEPPPSQTDLDAKASKDINEKNADAEFEKLKNEIEGGGGK